MLVLNIFSGLITLLACIIGAQTRCPDGWVVFRESCYLFSIENVHFTEAEHFCKQHRSHVVTIEDDLENKFIKSFLSQLKDGIWWMGLTDRIREGVWMWDETDEVATYTDWNPGQPNNHRDGNCAAFYDGYDFAWADLPCERNHNLVCELENTLHSVVG